MKRKPKTYYMHTIDGRPAFFAGDQVCFMNFYGKPSKLALSLKQIRKEQAKSREYRQSIGFSDDHDRYRLGYRRVCV